MADRLRGWIDRLLRYLMEFSAVIVFAFVITGAFEMFFKPWWLELRGFLRLWWLTLIGTIVVLLIGFGLFFFKKYYQKVYGLAEIGFALAVGWASVMKVQLTNDVASWASVIASAYLVVRGLSNYDEGKRRKTS